MQAMYSHSIASLVALLHAHRSTSGQSEGTRSRSRSRASGRAVYFVSSMRFSSAAYLAPYLSRIGCVAL